MKLKPSAHSSTMNENFDNTTETLLKTRRFSKITEVDEPDTSLKSEPAEPE